MKEYTYINKAYLGIKEGVVPPAPQYLWLNSKDDKLYKFGDDGWEMINNAPYIVDEFTVEDIIAQSIEDTPQLTISRTLLDAMYKGVPIMVKVQNNIGAYIPISVNIIINPNERTWVCFNVNYLNIKYEVSFLDRNAITDSMTALVSISTYNLVDWNTNYDTDSGYIANRTHHLGIKRGSYHIGQRISLAGTKGRHFPSNYKILYDGKFYDLPPMVPDAYVNISSYFRIIFTGYSESNNTSTYTFASQQYTTLPSQTFEIYVDLEEMGHKTLDEFYLPEETKPWKVIPATPLVTEGRTYRFRGIDNNVNIALGENVIRNKVIYSIRNAGLIDISVPISNPLLEFKIKVSGAHQFNISSKCAWEDGTKPQVSSGEEVIYSFLVMGGFAYISAKVYKMVK